MNPLSYPRKLNGLIRTKAGLIVALVGAIFTVYYLIPTSENSPTPSASAPAPFQPITLPQPTKEEITSALRPSLAQALAFTGSASPSERLSLIYKFPDDLSEIENKAVLAKLLAPPSADASPGWHAEFLHALCLLLQRSLPDPHLFSRTLLTLAHDSSRPLVIRDYAIQHLAQFYSSPFASDDHAAIVSSLLDLAQNSTPVSAPALLALHFLGPPDRLDPTFRGETQPKPAVSDQDLTPLLAAILSSPSPLPTTMAALRTIADRKLTTHRPTLRALINNPDHPALLRASALGSLASFQDPDDSSFFASLPPSDHPLLSQAIAHARSSSQVRSR